jgi:hypothetical protein
VNLLRGRANIYLRMYVNLVLRQGKNVPHNVGGFGKWRDINTSIPHDVGEFGIMTAQKYTSACR